MYRILPLLAFLALTGPLILAGCTDTTTDKQAKGSAPAPDGADAKIQAQLEKLDPEDRKLAEAQKWCAVETDNPLGEMGKPVKLMVNGQPVFLCCMSCKKKAEANADKTLETVATLKAKASAAKTP